MEREEVIRLDLLPVALKSMQCYATPQYRYQYPITLNALDVHVITLCFCEIYSGEMESGLSIKCQYLCGRPHAAYAHLTSGE